MLSSLSLSNFALFKKQNIEFKDGFNCLIGQSGAGKSIVIDALSFSLGAKADKNFIRTGETALRVDAEFVKISDEVRNLLAEWEIDDDDSIIISRTLSQDGKSSIKLNGFPITLKMLQTLASKLADFCGQHDSVGLLSTSNHLGFLDDFIGKEVESFKSELETELDEFKQIEQKIEALGGSDEQREREKELLEYQINEIENASLQVGEVEELKQRFDFVSSAEKIFEVLGNVTQMLDGQRDNVTSQLFECKNLLSNFSNFSEIEDCRQRLENAYYDIKDVSETLENIKQNTEFDEKELERIDSRLDLIKNLSKKYGKSVEDILDYQKQCQERLDELDNSQFLLNKLEKELKEKHAKIEKICSNLSEVRKKYALDFENKLTKQLEDLEMTGTHFKVEFSKGEISKKGFDNIKFMFSANKGQEMKELHKTASGGELSRLLLAFKNVMLDKEKVETIVFDEIDSGISGRTAGKLAEKLKNISTYSQIICITHTAVVASRADEFLLVEKNVIGENTVSTVKALEQKEAIEQVARLIDGSSKVSKTAIEHAEQLFSEQN